MISIKNIEHKLLKSKDLTAICEIKSFAWSYNIESQKLWISQNLKDNDIHFLLFDSDELVAYMNLVKVEVIIDSVYVPIYGIGNVCSKIKGRGYGGILMTKIGEYLNENQLIGLLFCKNLLKDFYLRYDWILIDKIKVDISYEATTDFNVMSYNLHTSFNKLQYKDRMF
jgi:Acetyltransferase (GNAT) domain